MSQSTLAVIILTKDEAANLPHWLASLAGLAADVFVVDSGSADGTVGLARSLGAEVLSHPWTNYATQFNWALDNIETSADWILRLDADEMLTPELWEALRTGLPRMSADVCGILVRLRIHFLGRWIRHGGMYPIWLLRVWRRGSGRCEERWMDEHVSLTSGRAVKIQADLIHESRNGLNHWMQKHLGYAVRECRDISSGESTSASLRGQAKTTRWLKEKLYGRCPLYARAWLYWIYRYFVRAGFLDGAEGFTYHFFQALWYRSLIDAHLFELRLPPGGQGHDTVENLKDRCQTD